MKYKRKWNVISGLKFDSREKNNKFILRFEDQIVTKVLDNTLSMVNMHGDDLVEDFDESKYNSTLFGNITDLDQFLCVQQYHDLEVSTTWSFFLT